MNPEEDAFGPYVHGACVILLPRQTDSAEIRADYIKTLDLDHLPHSDTSSDYSDPQDIYQGPLPTRFLRDDKGVVIHNPYGGEHTAQRISRLACKEALLVQPLGKAAIWTYVFYRDGHVLDRHASCPEWIPEGYLGDPDFEEYQRIHGRAKALRDYMNTWRGDGRKISALFGVEMSKVDPYLRQFTSAELEEWGESRRKYSEHKVHPADRYSIASPWVLVHFVEQLGFPDFRDSYWTAEKREDPEEAGPVFSPARHRWARVLENRPKCATDPFPFGGFFWNHDAVCGTQDPA